MCSDAKKQVGKNRNKFAILEGKWLNSGNVREVGEEYDKNISCRR